MRSIFGVGVARDERAGGSHSGFYPTRYEIAGSPNPAVLHTSTLPIKGRVGWASLAIPEHAPFYPNQRIAVKAYFPKK